MLRGNKRVKSVRLGRYGPFKDCTFTFPTNKRNDLAEVHVFTGGNGSGKTTLLYSLASIFDHPGNKDKPGYPVYEMQARANLGGNHFECAFDFPPPSGNQTLESQNFSKQDKEWLRINGWSDVYWVKGFNDQDKEWRKKDFDFLPIAYNGQRPFARDIGNHLSIQEFTESPLANHLAFGQSIDPNQVTQWIANVLAKEAFALRDNDPAKASNFRYALNRLTQAINDIAQGDFSFKLDTTTLDVKVVWHGDELRINVLPDGMKSIIALLSDILMRMDRLPWADSTVDVLDQPLILFLDEIDIHLHPQWQRKILPTVQKLFRNAQIFVSTHSPFVVGSVSDAWVYRLDEAQADNPSGQPLEIKPIPSGAGTSYEVLLEEIFDVGERFDIETQHLYADFKKERNLLLTQPDAPDENLKRLALTLMHRSEELNGLIALELRQMKKLGRAIVFDRPEPETQDATDGQI